MKKKIQFSLVYRDMFQSSGKYQPRKDQLERVAPAIIRMGCFARVETNGGAFEQVNLLYGENPNQAVRAFTKPFNEVGIKTHMLDRGLNALRMFPVPADVRKLMYHVKHAQGVDIPRIFCGLNDVRNIIPSIHYALDAGMTPQATLCITTSPIHTAEYYSEIADKLIAEGAPEICLKDMAGIGQPAMLGRLVAMIKAKHPEIIIQYHGHSGPGLSMASILEVCRAGADIIDTAVEPLSWGKIHPDIISVQSMLKNEGFAAEYNPGQILNLSFNVSHIRPLTRKNPRWYMIASLGAGIYSAPNDIAWRSWLVNGGLIFAYKLRDNLDVGIGAGLTNSFGVPLVMPMTFVKWTSTGEYEILIEATANIKASIARQFTDKFKLALIPCEMGGMSSVFREDGKNKLYSVMQMKAYLRPEYKLGKHSSVYLNAGMDLFHSVNITDRSIKGFADNFNKEERWKFKQAFNILVGYNYSF